MEKWKKIADFEDRYEISNLGNVKSLNYLRTGKAKILKLCNHTGGYLSITLRRNNFVKTFFVHRLVAIHFIKNPENKPQVNHKNGIKKDNRRNNLEWCTGFENQQHSKITLKNDRSGELHPTSRLKEKDILEIRELSKSKNQREIANIYGVNQCHISEIINRKKWKHI